MTYADEMDLVLIEIRAVLGLVALSGWAEWSQYAASGEWAA